MHWWVGRVSLWNTGGYSLRWSWPRNATACYTVTRSQTHCRRLYSSMETVSMACISAAVYGQQITEIQASHTYIIIIINQDLCHCLLYPATTIKT